MIMSFLRQRDTEPKVYVGFSPRFEQIRPESRKSRAEYMEQKRPMPRSGASTSTALELGKNVRRGQSQNNLTGGTPAGVRFGVLESIKDAGGNVIKEAPLPVWANFQQLALGVAMLEVNAKTDLKIKLVSIEPLKHESLEEKMLARRGGSNL